MNGAYFMVAIIVGAAFTFTSIAVWTSARAREREAFYKNDALRRMAEMPGEAAKHVIEYLREEERIKREALEAKERKTQESMRAGGVVNIAVGIGLAIFLYAMDRNSAVYLAGLLPALIGVALLVYGVYFAPKWEKPGARTEGTGNRE